jgi:hypothetical protein
MIQLTNLNLKHSAQVHLDPLVPSILSRLHRYPPSHPLYPHSSLLNAMYLIAIFYLSSSRHPTRVRHRIKWNAFEVEMTFLSKTRKAMARNLSLVENLLDYLLSSNILSKYLYGNMRQIEAHHESTGECCAFEGPEGLLIHIHLFRRGTVCNGLQSTHYILRRRYRVLLKFFTCVSDERSGSVRENKRFLEPVHYGPRWECLCWIRLCNPR